MTRKLEEELNLPSIDDFSDEDKSSTEVSQIKDRDEAIQTANAIMSSLSTSEKIDSALPTISGLEIHDSEMDDISKRAIDTYEELVHIGRSSPVMYSCKVYEVAGQVLKTAMDARDSKINKKIKMLELQMKKMKLDDDTGNGKKSDDEGLDRNAIFDMIKNSAAQPTPKKKDDK